MNYVKLLNVKIVLASHRCRGSNNNVAIIRIGYSPTFLTLVGEESTCIVDVNNIYSKQHNLKNYA